MAIGYACLTVGVEGVNYKTCRKENADEKTLWSLANEYNHLYSSSGKRTGTDWISQIRFKRHKYEMGV